MDEEDGIGLNSLYPYYDDMEQSKIVLYYSDLKFQRTMEWIYAYGDGYQVLIDTAWGYNDETRIYVRTPKDENDLYGCYRYELDGIKKDDSVVNSTKVYRNKE